MTASLPSPAIDVTVAGQRIAGYTAEQVQLLLSAKDRQIQAERDYAAEAAARVLKAELAQRRAESLLPLPILARLLEELQLIESGHLPDGDGVDVSTALWAERWLARLDHASKQRETEPPAGLPGHLHVQLFTEQRTGMKVGMPETMVKVTDLRTGRYVVGHGERSQHLNRAKAIAALAANCPSVPVAAQAGSRITFLPGRPFTVWEPMPLQRALQSIADGEAEAGMEIRLLYTEPVPPLPIERERETPRRRAAVEKLLELGFVWSDQGQWSPRDQERPVAVPRLSPEANRHLLQSTYTPNARSETPA